MSRKPETSRQLFGLRQAKEGKCKLATMEQHTLAFGHNCSWQQSQMPNAILSRFGRSFEIPLKLQMFRSPIIFFNIAMWKEKRCKCGTSVRTIWHPEASNEYKI